MDSVGWTSFAAFPRVLRAETALNLGDLSGAADDLELSYALACQVGDPCWEGYALRGRGRGRGRLAAAAGDDAAALELLRAAPAACRRQCDSHDWVEGYCLDALCSFAVDRALPEARGWVDQLEMFAAARGMRELVARAAIHQSRQGRPGAAELAEALTSAIDNPALAAELDHRAGPGAPTRGRDLAPPSRVRTTRTPSTRAR